MKNISRKKKIISLPTDTLTGISNSDLVPGMQVCLLDRLGFAIGKATVVTYPTTDQYIRDQETLDVNDWVSLIIIMKKRGSRMDVMPSRNEKRSWEVIGKNCFITWPMAMVAHVDEYEEVSHLNFVINIAKYFPNRARL
ncbi:uncharacterized protein [Argopecten irradians]|uniref:uncharacterized protein n=1 Tax=Argopecten irradians TaxID=31199 RepID=UPI00371673B1